MKKGTIKIVVKELPNEDVDVKADVDGTTYLLLDGLLITAAQIVADTNPKAADVAINDFKKHIEKALNKIE